MYTLPSAPELVMALGSMELLTEVQVRSLMSQGLGTSEELLDTALSQGWLTTYQREQIAAGRTTGLLLGPYRILEPIGAGGMGQVFKARHPLMNRVVAVKVIRPERLGSGEALARFRQEIQAVAQLAHPNIVRAYDANQERGVYYLAMEWIDGTDVAKYLAERQQLPVAQACDIIRQAALGLQHAHEAGLVHRDLKPANLLLTRAGVVKILDFGLARLGTTDLTNVDLEADETDPSSRLTQAGVLMGTPDYIAPEQTYDSHTVDIRADLYSLGCTLYELLVGRPPFASAKQLGRKLQAHRVYPPDNRLETVRGDAPPGLIVVMQSLLAKQPEHRLATPALLAQALAPYAGGDAGVRLPLMPPALVPPSPAPAPPPATTVDEAPQVPETPIPGPTQPLAVMPGAPPAAAPLVASPKVAVSDKLRWMEAAISGEENRALRAEVDALMAVADGHVESGNWLGAYDAAMAVLEVDPHHADAQAIVDRLQIKLQAELRTRRAQVLFSQTMMGLGVGGMITAIPLAVAWLGEQIETRWQGWGVMIVAYLLRGLIGLWMGGMISLGLCQAVTRRLTRRPSPRIQTIREVVSASGALAAIVLWCLLPSPFSWWAFGIGYVLLVLVHLLAPGGNPFGGDQEEAAARA